MIYHAASTLPLEAKPTMVLLDDRSKITVSVHSTAVVLCMYIVDCGDCSGVAVSDAKRLYHGFDVYLEGYGQKQISYIFDLPSTTFWN